MTIWYNLAYFILVIFFAYFYNTIAYDPDEIAKNIQKQGGFIPGIRPGKPTADYIAGVIYRLTLPASIFLGLVAVLPDLFMQLFGMGRLFLFGGTSLLIVIGVALEIFRQLEHMSSLGITKASWSSRYGQVRCFSWKTWVW